MKFPVRFSTPARSRPAPAAARPSPVADICGHIDRIDGLWILGWVADFNDLSRKLVVEAVAGETTLGTATANIFRPDLEQAGIGDGRHSFACEVKQPKRILKPSPIRLRVRGVDYLVPYQGRTSIQIDFNLMDFIVADIVNNCNLRCPFCVVDYSTTKKTELMSEQTFRRAIELVRCVPDGAFYLSCLHEPTLHPNLVDLIYLVPEKYRRKICFTSNMARPLSEEIFLALAKSGIHHINISLDTMSPALFAVLRKFGRYEVFQANLDRMARIFSGVSGAPRLRYITMAFQSNLEEIPRIVEYARQQWLSSDHEIRYTYNVQHIQDEFRKQHYLRKEQRPGLSAALAKLEGNYTVVYPPEDGYEETILPSGNYFELTKLGAAEKKPKFTRPLSLRIRPDGNIVLANQETQFGVNVNTLEDPVDFFWGISSDPEPQQ